MLTRKRTSERKVLMHIERAADLAVKTYPYFSSRPTFTGKGIGKTG